MATGTLEAKVVAAEVQQFASIFRAYIACSGEEQEIIREMALIVDSDEATSDEKSRAVGVMIEALFPSLAREEQTAIEAWAASESAAQTQVQAEEQCFADNVRRYLKSMGLSQEDLAKRIGAGQSAIANILARKCRPQQRTVMKIAKALDVEPEALWQCRR